MQDVFTTDGQLLGGKFKVLADPKHVFGFQNVAPIVKKSVLGGRGPGVRRNAQQGQRAADDPGDPADEQGGDASKSSRRRASPRSSSRPTAWLARRRAAVARRVSCEAARDAARRRWQRVARATAAARCGSRGALRRRCSSSRSCSLPKHRRQQDLLARRPLRQRRERARQAWPAVELLWGDADSVTRARAQPARSARRRRRKLLWEARGADAHRPAPPTARAIGPLRAERRELAQARAAAERAART